MRRKLQALAIAVIAVVLVACDKAAPPPPEASSNPDTTLRGGKAADRAGDTSKTE